MDATAVLKRDGNSDDFKRDVNKRLKLRSLAHWGVRAEYWPATVMMIPLFIIVIEGKRIVGT
ncbi:MAG: hypothetical protein DWQ28_13200 [Proteobacteria bacterium]|nr:MAG: hypothetical protein DWQ28_13200 [Pseudomonadota bacterium]